MKYSKIQFFILIVILVVGSISCSQKFPKPISKEVGMLVIAHKATNESKQNMEIRSIG